MSDTPKNVDGSPTNPGSITKRDSGSQKKAAGSEKASGTGSTSAFKSYESSYVKYGAGSGSGKEDTQNLRPPVYRRIAVVRYVRPMMTYEQSWDPYYSGCGGYPYGYCNTSGGAYNCGGQGYPGECPQTTGILVIPPRSKALYRSATDEDFMHPSLLDDCPSFLKIDGECQSHVPEKEGKQPPANIRYIVPPPPKPVAYPIIIAPQPLPPSKPKVDKEPIMRKYFYDVGRRRSRTRHPSPPKTKHHHRSKKKSPPKEKSPPRDKSHKKKKTKKKKSPPPKKKKSKSPPKKEKKPKKEEKPKPPPKKEEKPKSPPKKEEKPKEENPPPPPPPIEEPPPPPPPPPVKKDSSASSVPTTNEGVHYTDNENRELHHHGDARRRGSSFDALDNAATLEKHDAAHTAAVAPRKRKLK